MADQSRLTVEQIKRLKSWQSAAGAFSSTIMLRNHQEVDWNGFATALVLRELHQFSVDPELRDLQERSLDFLEQCVSTQFPAAFSFWPTSTRPKWASLVPADVDDTAIMSLELYRYKRLNYQDLLKTIAILPD
jgi:hypothetical protein